ncbi:hypothetical protein PHABIO_290 [Pseudomonas phage Phabio]|uniref:DUF3307 domain-containing protein n=1 Tax=Pseudomonas phage Phabio TaxID=2006668 RepID=A0A1Y0STU7_9CAUD|nr:membrane protein [Pseudomonas phage Phabio]ARV76921.1 hypothetical protein PHABIO_290 [Pseudomonas phage Phabio]
MEIVLYAIMFFLLMAGHYLGDYALQNDFIANAKNHKTELGKLFWKHVLPAHGMIHALPVFLITQSLVLALFEFVAHCVIDYLKCDGKLTFNQDQWLHYGCKVLYVVLLATGVPYLI